MAAQFTKKLKTRPKAHEQSPAQIMGLESKILKFYEFFDELRSSKQIPLPEEWELILQNKVPYPRARAKTAEFEEKIAA